MVYASTFWLNSFSPDDEVSTTLSSQTIITGYHIDYNKHCKLEFGSYVQTHEDHDNSMATHTVGALAQWLTRNIQDGHYFYSLAIGQVLHQNR
jgi:hypothetical protein